MDDQHIWVLLISDSRESDQNVGEQVGKSREDGPDEKRAHHADQVQIPQLLVKTHQFPNIVHMELFLLLLYFFFIFLLALTLLLLLYYLQNLLLLLLLLQNRLTDLLFRIVLFLLLLHVNFF